MSVTEYEMGDDWARGIVAECPRCDAHALVHGVCEECGYNGSDYDPFDYEDDDDYERGDY